MKRLFAGLFVMSFAVWAGGTLRAQDADEGPPGGRPAGLGGPGGGFRTFGPPGGFGRMGGDKLMLLGNQSVQGELKLSEKQVKQIDLRVSKQRESFAELREMEPEDAERAIAKQTKTNEALVSKLLTADQLKRLNEISIQMRGTRALADPPVAKTLALNGGQKKKIQEILDDSQDEMRSAFEQFGGQGGPGGPGGFGRGPGGPGGFGAPGGGRGGFGGRGGQAPGAPGADGAAGDGRPAPPAAGGNAEGGAQNPGGLGQGGEGGNRERGGRGGAGGQGGPDRESMSEAFKKMGELRDSTDKKLLAVLTDKQQAKWQEMQGEPFKMEFGGPGFDRGGRGRGPRGGGEGAGPGGDGAEGAPADGERPPRRRGGSRPPVDPE